MSFKSLSLKGTLPFTLRPGVVFDLDVAGRVLGIEMLDVSQRTDNPRELAMELVGV